MTISNPVLPGFHPDPSILRVGEDYYIANSTFEWHGGVEIHHSRNLRDWEFVGRPLATLEHLDMRGNPESGGIWAPCLSWADGLFWLIFTDVKTWDTGPFKDTHNYLTTAADIRGPWSKPVYLNSSGFDPSLFHDDDGKKWLVNMEWDYRKTGSQAFSGILLQQFDPRTRNLFGPVHKIFGGTPIGLVEGPHLYKRQGWYYLLVAEGGTAFEHAASVARSRSIDGPYEVHPRNPLITSAGKPALPLQKAGHASWCDTPDGQWMLAYLCGRPLPGRKDCVLGRETALAPLTWTDGWPSLAGGGQDAPARFEFSLPGTESPAPESVRLAGSGKRRQYHFADEGFRADFMTLRIPNDETISSIHDRAGWLRLYGKESLVSRHRQALVCRRQTDFSFIAETKMEFDPFSFDHMAGLIYRYDELNQYYLRATWDEKTRQKTLGLLKFDQKVFSMPMGDSEIVYSQPAIWLRLTVDNADAQFWYSLDARTWLTAGPRLDAGILSDEHGKLGFTGAFVGMACQDLRDQKRHADFAYFCYEGRDIR